VLRWEESCKTSASRQPKSRFDQGESTMQKSRFILSGITVLTLLLFVSVTRANAQTDKLVGTWEVTLQPNSVEGAAAEGGDTDTETLIISQEGGKYKVTHKSHRGDQTCGATVDGSSIYWTEERKTIKGDIVKVNYSATLNGRTLDGSYKGGPFDRAFTAKRAR
jgi:hypothetical protein